MLFRSLIGCKYLLVIALVIDLDLILIPVAFINYLSYPLSTTVLNSEVERFLLFNSGSCNLNFGDGHTPGEFNKH